jgi:hypothetical protein
LCIASGFLPNVALSVLESAAKAEVSGRDQGGFLSASSASTRVVSRP